MPAEYREVIGGQVMRGFTDDGPAREYATVETVMPCGGILREYVLRDVPPPEPEAPPQANSAPSTEPPTDGAP